MPVLYVVRHGETDFNVARRLQGRTETRLNALGRQQAQECGTLLAELFARDKRAADSVAYTSSPLLRARETMELLRATLGLDMHAYTTDPRLMEISYGAWEGMTLAEIETHDLDTLKRRESDKWDFAPPGGESYRAVAQRVADWYAGVTHDTVVVAHGGVVRVLMASFHLLSEDAAVHADILHGTIYVFADGRLTRYS